jgi:putative acetyltransferase
VVVVDTRLAYPGAPTCRLRADGAPLTAFAIRTEAAGDCAAVDAVVRAAFVRHPDDVARFAEAIKASEHAVPELSLVAEDESGVIGHVMLSYVPIEGGARPRLLVLTPLSVRPDRQGRGVGAALTRAVLERAEALGEPAVLLEGIPAYYPRFGFERASALGFVAPSPSIPDEAFMVKRLSAWEPGVAGRVVYPPAYDHLGD